MLSRKVRRTVVLVGLSIWLPSISFAHAYLVKSLPPARATLFASPDKIQLWFNERLESRYSSASVFDPDGKRVDLDAAQVSPDDPKQLAIDVRQQLQPGKYTVNFRVLSVDGHVVEQSFPFTIRARKK